MGTIHQLSQTHFPVADHWIQIQALALNEVNTPYSAKIHV
jgi:hypothetical protein